jgi:hypothetical protein
VGSKLKVGAGSRVGGLAGGRGVVGSWVCCG